MSPPLAGSSAGFGVFTSSLSGVAHPVGLAAGDHDGGVVQEPVEDGDGGGVFGQEAAPVLEGPVGADGQGAAFVGGGDEAEQQLGAGVVQRCEPDLVDLCGHPHRWIYADTATMPRTGCVGLASMRGGRFCSA
jgi:hypothetical protein